MYSVAADIQPTGGVNRDEQAGRTGCLPGQDGPLDVASGEKFDGGLPAGRRHAVFGNQPVGMVLNRLPVQEDAPAEGGLVVKLSG